MTADVELTSEIVSAVGSDGHTYSVRPYQWSVDKIDEFSTRVAKLRIYSDAAPMTPDRVAYIVLSGKALWFDVIDERDDSSVGLMCLTNFQSMPDGRPYEAEWHALVWDSHVGIRRSVAQAALKKFFYLFKLHRIQVRIALKFGGTIRNAKRIGFVEEGVLRSSARYNGVWYDQLMLSLLASEAEQWAI